MIEIAIMLEGQMGLNWQRLEAIAHKVEELGFVGLYRSDHFTNPSPPDMDSLELWTSLTWLASQTTRIEFGPLVAPFSFRHPSNMARMAAAVDDLSGGRLRLGLGAGWQAREHDNYGFELGSVAQRLARLEEGLEVVTRLLGSAEPVSYQGEFYTLHDAILLPRPQRPGGPPIVVGGNGIQRILPLAARYAAEWNGTSMPVADYSQRCRRLDELLEQAGRKPTDLRRSLMVGTIFGRTEPEALEIARRWGPSSLDQLRERGTLAGTGEQIAEQIGAYAEAGCQRIML